MKNDKAVLQRIMGKLAVNGYSTQWVSKQHRDLLYSATEGKTPLIGWLDDLTPDELKRLERNLDDDIKPDDAVKIPRVK